MSKTILFVTYGGGHAHMVYPVVHALRATQAYADGQIAIRVLGLPAARDILERNGVTCTGFADYLDEKRDVQALRWGKELAQTHHSPTVGVSREESIAYLGLSYQDLVERLGEQEAARQLAKKGRQAFYPLTVMERIFDDIRPDFVVTTNSPRAEAVAIEVANRRDINNLSMIDLFARVILCELHAKNLTFINEYAKDMLVEEGYITEQGSHFYYTGNPAFDKILAIPKEKDPDWLAQHFPQASGRKIILHADTPGYYDYFKKYSYIRSHEEIRKELDTCYEAVRKNDAVYFIRPHPSQDQALFLKWMEGKKNAYLTSAYDLYDLLRNMDLLLVRISTVSIEAAYMGKRVLQVGCDFHVDFPLAAMGIAWGAKEYDELPLAIKNALSDDKEFARIKERTNQLLPAEPAAPKIAGIILEKLQNM